MTFSEGLVKYIRRSTTLFDMRSYLEPFLKSHDYKPSSYATSMNVAHVLGVLRCFRNWCVEQYDHHGPESIFPEPLRWLATLIIRSRSDYTALFE